MTILKILKKNINAAVQTAQNNGTTFYSVTLDRIIDYYSDSTRNVWIRQAFIERDWDAIDFDNNLFGSQVVDDVLYICVTNGDMVVNETHIDPEEALEIYSPDEIAEYIKPATDDIIKRYITEYEIKMPDFDNWAITILNDGYDFAKLVKDCTDFSYFDFL